MGRVRSRKGEESQGSCDAEKQVERTISVVEEVRGSRLGDEIALQRWVLVGSAEISALDWATRRDLAPHGAGAGVPRRPKAPRCPVDGREPRNPATPTVGN